MSVPTEVQTMTKQWLISERRQDSSTLSNYSHDHVKQMLNPYTCTSILISNPRVRWHAFFYSC